MKIHFSLLEMHFPLQPKMRYWNKNALRGLIVTTTYTLIFLCFCIIEDCRTKLLSHVYWIGLVRLEFDQRCLRARTLGCSIAALHHEDLLG